MPNPRTPRGAFARALTCARRAFVAACCLSLTLAPSAEAASTAAVTLSSSSWTLVGPGPMLLAASGGPLQYAIADVQPNIGAPAFTIYPQGDPRLINTSSNVWALAPSGYATVAVAASGAGILAASGSLGADNSANKPALPNVGANFGASGVYANYLLITTVPANPSRLSIDVENTSGAQIVIVRDDGTAASGAAPVNASAFVLAGGAAAGAQGGSWTSQTFKGRVQVYAPSSSAQVAVMVE